MRCFIIITILLSASCALNKTDKQGRKQGRWRTYYDAEKKQLLYKGKYKDHYAVGTFRYYYPDRTKYLKEKYQKNSWVKTCYYYPNGKKKAEGYAQLITDKDTIFYRWEGDWTKYDSAGKVTQVDFYKLGKFAWVTRKGPKRN